MHQLLRCLAVVLATTLAGQAMAADLGGSYARQCFGYVDSQLPSRPTAQIREIMTDYFDTAKAAMSEPAVVVSRNPAFTWAYEARIACGNAIGYLKTGHVDEVSVQKCDCFYQRFVSFR